MGWGDEIMATGEARLLQERDPRPVAVRSATGKARWHPIFEGNPRLSRDGAGDVQWLHNWSGNRPYIAAYSRTRYTFRSYRPPPGEIYFSAAETQQGARGRGLVLVEPTIGPAACSVNKDWGFARWQALIRLLPGVPWAQMGPSGTRWLEGAARLETADFRSAAAVLARALLYVGPEGGLHHAAAAVGTPAVVLFGGFNSPEFTGYDTHCNLHPGGTPCGQRLPCEHCRRAWEAITPDLVARKTEAMLCSR